MNFLAFGEVLFDVIDGESYLGGAPLNVAANLSLLGMKSGIVSAVGDDELGKRALMEIEKLGVSCEYISVNKKYDTGVANVFLENRNASYEIVVKAAYDFITLDKISNPKEIDVIYLGTLAFREKYNKECFENLLEKVSPKYIFLDVNLRKDCYCKESLNWAIKKASLLKLSNEEVMTVSELLFGTELKEKELVEKIFLKYAIMTIIITKGKDGATIYEDNEVYDILPIDVEVIDTVGAGDAFSSAFIYSYYYGNNSLEASKFASKVAADVVSSNGAIPGFSNEIIKEAKNIIQDNVNRHRVLVNRANRYVKRKEMLNRKEQIKGLMHFMPPYGWLNDPNGPYYENGEYHIFYQYNPYDIKWGNMHWGHTSTRDFCSYINHPIALAPTPNSSDADGVFSGCSVKDNDQRYHIYTGVMPEVQMIAKQIDPDTFKKVSIPIISNRPLDNLNGFRDPFVWKENDRWFMLLGSGIIDETKRGVILRYMSYDLKNWKYEGIFYEGDPKYGMNFECPLFIRFDNNMAMLCISPQYMDSHGPSIYVMGEYVNGVFTASKVHTLDEGKSFYAPNVLKDDIDRNIMFGWINYRRKNVTGAFSLPRHIFIDDNNDLNIKPVNEIEEYYSSKKICFNMSNMKVEVLDNQIKLELPILMNFVLKIVYENEKEYFVKWQNKNKVLTLNNIEKNICDIDISGNSSMALYIDNEIHEWYIDKAVCITDLVYTNDSIIKYIEIDDLE